MQAALARGIPARRLNSGSLVQLGYGARQRRILASETDRTSSIAESIAQDKELTRTLLLLGATEIDEAQATETLHILLKYQSDIQKAAKELSAAAS